MVKLRTSIDYIKYLDLISNKVYNLWVFISNLPLIYISSFLNGNGESQVWLSTKSLFFHVTAKEVQDMDQQGLKILKLGEPNNGYLEPAHYQSPKRIMFC